MTKQTPVIYHRIEVESFLPSGWGLGADEPSDGWNDKADTWSTTVIDGVDFPWPLTVKASDAETMGRLPALRTAMDRVYRTRLGNHTRGLGRG